MKFNQSQWAICIAILLSACGGSGNDASTVNTASHNTIIDQISRPNTSTTPANDHTANIISQLTQSNQTITSPNQPITPPNTNTSDKINGYYSSVYADDHLSAILPLNSNKLAKLIIEDQTFNINRGKKDLLNGENIGDGAMTDLDGDVISGRYLSHTKYGFLQHNLASPVLFFQGEHTKDMPQSGIVNYQGHAIVHFPSDHGYDPYFTSKVRADFDRKTLTGMIGKDLETNSNNHVEFEARIFGNQFRGIDNRGYFYGPQAEEVAGIVDVLDGNTKQPARAVFGAKRQVNQ